MMGKLILLVIAVLGIGMAVPSTRAKMAGAAAPLVNKVKAKLVPARLEAMADQLAVRVNRGQGYPDHWENWLRSDYSGVPEDPWGNVYYLAQDRSGFTVGSNGPDGVARTPDDITVRRRLGR